MSPHTTSIARPKQRVEQRGTTRLRTIQPKRISFGQIIGAIVGATLFPPTAWVLMVLTLCL